MKILPDMKYRRFPAAMPGVIVSMLVGLVTLACNVPSLAAVPGKLELADRNSVDRCSAATQAQISASPDCCCAQPALMKGDTPKPSKVAMLMPLTADLALLHPVFVVVANSDQARLSTTPFSLPVYLATQRLRI